MPDTNFFFVNDDLYELAEYAFQLGCWIVPGLHYPKPEVLEIKTLENLRECREVMKGQIFFLLSHAYVRSPLQLGQIDIGGKQIYYISQKNGGPTIDIFMSHTYEKEGVSFIPSGHIGHHSTYWDTKSLQMEKPPDELKLTYQKLLKAIRRSAKLIRLEDPKVRRRFYVGKHAQTLLAQGCKFGSGYDGHLVWVN